MSNEPVPTLDELEKLAAPIVETNHDLCAKERQDVVKKLAASPLYSSDDKTCDPESVEEVFLIITKSVVTLQGVGPVLSLTTLDLHKDTSPAFVERLMSKSAICQLILFQVKCRGYRHLRCGRTVLVTPENVHHFSRCFLCYALLQDDKESAKRQRAV